MGRSDRSFARRVSFLLAAASLAVPCASRADAPAPARPPAPRPVSTVDVPSGAGQDTLHVEVTPEGIIAQGCPISCSGSPISAAYKIPDVPSEALKGTWTAQQIKLQNGRHVLQLSSTIDGKDGATSTWTALLAAPITYTKSDKAVVLWTGYVGQSRGLEGEEAVNVIRVEPLPGRTSRVIVGEQRADLTLCGRPVLVSAREVDPDMVALAKTSATMVDSLTEAERKGAEKVIATRDTTPWTAPAVRLLRANAASSALDKKMATLTDGDLSTAWTEGKIGDGHGEWVRMSASSDVGITGLSVKIRPQDDGEISGGAAPKTLYFATDSKIFAAEIPESAWGDKDARYEVKLPAEVRTSCLAVVIGDAHTPKDVDNPRVTIAEITAHTALDSMSYDALAGALATGDDRSKAAAAMLSKGDARAVTAINAAWEHYTEAGRALALDVVDGLACSDQAPFYADRLAAAKGKKMAGPTAEPIVVRARDRLRRCGRASAPALSKLIREAADPIKVVAAEELALVAPGEAIGAILDALPKAPDPVRRDLRAALARAANSPKAKGEVADWLVPAKFGALGDVAKVDLLRAMGPVLPEIEGGKKALFGLLTKEAPFRTRYLLLAPAAELAAKGDVEAESVVRDALAKGDDPHLRTRAAEVAGKVPKLAPALVTAAADSEVRVREAAVRALATAAGLGTVLPAGAETALVARIGTDDWTFVRVGAAEALSAMPKSDVADKALAGALSDKSVDVRGAALDGLGAHRAVAFAGPVRARAEASDELVDVRARALTALGSMCDKGSLDLLTRVAQGARSLSSDVDRRLGAAALSALGELSPSDLASRIQLLLAADAPPLVREMAKSALAAKSKCAPENKT
ncbi:MAG: HEAT repeat domain-containing protein [Polyangiaceae bacterium]